MQNEYTGATFGEVRQNTLSLYWDGPRVARIMAEHGVENRSHLAQRLEKAHIARPTVYRAFSEEWEGEAPPAVVVAIAKMFSVPLSELLVEPSSLGAL